MKHFWQRYPWFPLALLMGCFMLAWLAWLITAIRHAPETVPTSLTPTPKHVTPR